MVENIECSFAVVYDGPPIPFDIPRATPIEIHRIPIASISAATSAFPPIDSLPIIQPLPLKNPNPSPIAVVTRDDVIVSSSELRGTAGDRASTDSSLASDDFENNFENDDDDDDDVEVAVTTAAVVTFRETDLSSSLSSRSGTVKVVKKGSCYRCSKGSWFTEKESCLVCDARYCSGCFLRAMGSMPEGRKCVGCIGKSIDDSKREKLGKSSGLLKRLLSSLEVEQVMKSERYCEANQLKPEDVCVNRKPLIHEELVLLQSCPCPPTKLKPGYYWYDKVSGFWGKEGHKPDKIISANLNVGGNLMENASNGNTGILINGREITKVEMRMLKLVGVQCAGKPHFWVDADGSYREEGQKDVKGNIWGKTRTKLLCSFLSLPVPSTGGNPSGEEVNNIINGTFPNFFEQRKLQKFILVGYDGSGTSTIFKQARFLYEIASFSEDERQSIKLLIQSSIYHYIGILLEGRERFEDEALAGRKKNQPCEFARTGVSDECDNVTVYFINQRLKVFSDWLLKSRAAGDLDAIFLAATREYAPTVEELWKDPAIQATYSRRIELQSLPSSAGYFLEKAVDISRVEYKLTDLDILYADGITSANGLTYTEFLFPRTAAEESGNDDSTYQQDALVRYQLIRLPTRGFGDNCKWLDMFEDVRIVIFCVSLSDYDEYYEDASGVAINRMMESKKRFESIVTHPTFQHMDFLLILNKFDLLEQKIENSPLTLCDWFDDFNPVSSRHNSNSSSSSHRNRNCEAARAEKAFQYIAVKFKRLFNNLTGRKLYVTSTKGLESESVDAALRYAREILKWEEERRPSTNDFSSYDVSSTDP